MMCRTSTVRAIVFSTLGVLLLAKPALAHVGGLSGTMDPGPVPTWLTVVTGGIVIGASFLFTSLLTDHDAIRSVNDWGIAFPTPKTIRTAAKWGLRGLSIIILGVIVITGLIGPETPTRNFAILVVWAGWWTGYTMSVYLVGNTWPVLNPWRALAVVLPSPRQRSYPERIGAWPSVVGLLGLVWLEVISPVAQDSQLLVAIILGYTVITLAGANIFGVETWFGTVDPVSRVFRCYGQMAPFQRTEDGITFKLPTTALTEHQVSDEPGATAFIIALLWVTTYDGLVATPTWGAAIKPLVALGIPPLLIYFVAIIAGFGLFYYAFERASRKSQQTAHSYVSANFIRRWFAPSLLPIAAGYHLAHFLGYFLSLSPALVTVAFTPFTPPAQVQVLVVPDWFSLLQLLFVLLGHMLAIWVAHALSFDLFPGILKPIRSQYPFIAVMIFYTMSSLWVVIQPFTSPPYV